MTLCVTLRLSVNIKSLKFFLPFMMVFPLAISKMSVITMINIVNDVKKRKASDSVGLDEMEDNQNKSHGNDCVIRLIMPIASNKIPQPVRILFA